MPRNKKRTERRAQRVTGKTIVDGATLDAATADEVGKVAATAPNESASENNGQSLAANSGELLDNELSENVLDENAMGDGAEGWTGKRNTVAASNKKAKAASRADPILVTLENSTLRMSDAQLLHGPRWLNEALINFYMAYLDEVKYKFNTDFIFLTAETTQCLPVIERKQQELELTDERNAHRKSFIFMPVNDGITSGRGGIFWSLLVASRPDNYFYHFDSHGGNNTDNSRDLFNSTKDVLGMGKARFRTMRCLQQKNDYDCGIHFMCMVDHLADYVNRFDSVEGVAMLHNDVITGKRNMLIKLINSMGKDPKK